MISIIIPGRKDPGNTNTFLQPLVEDFEKLRVVVPPFDRFLKE